MKNILLVVVDTLRADHLGCYGYERDVSPCLDRLAAQGTVLDSLWSASNFTAPAFTSLFTGLLPHQHGVFDFTSRVDRSQVFDVVRANRAEAEAVVTFRFFRNLLDSIWGGVEAVTDTSSFDYSKDLPRAVTESALRWLENRDRDRPFCLFVHYDGPHMPYRLPTEYADLYDSVDPAQVDPEVLGLLFPQDRDRLDDGELATDTMFKMLESVNWGRKKLGPDTLQWIIDKYDASIRYNDSAVGDLLAGLADIGDEQNTVVAVLSDHGEEFLEHGGISHSGIHLNEEVIRTVGVIRDPAAEQPPARLATPLSQVAVWPTLLNLAGADHRPGHWNTLDFASLLRRTTTEAEWRTPVVCQGKAKVAFRSGALKLIRALPSPTLGRSARFRLWLKMLLRRELGSEVYDLVKDPGETVNLAGDSSARRRLAKELAAFLDATTSTESRVAEADEAERKRIEKEMKDLGYM